MSFDNLPFKTKINNINEITENMVNDIGEPSIDGIIKAYPPNGMEESYFNNN